MAEAHKLKQTGMTIIAVGIGPDPSQEELKEIASAPENVFNAASYDLLAYIMQSLVRKTCDSKFFGFLYHFLTYGTLDSKFFRYAYHFLFYNTVDSKFTWISVSLLIYIGK